MRASSSVFRARRLAAMLIVAAIALGGAVYDFYLQEVAFVDTAPARPIESHEEGRVSAQELLTHLDIKGRAPKTGYERSQFGAGWSVDTIGCTTRNSILRRDLLDVVVDENCRVLRGTLRDPYTGKEIVFERGNQTSSKVQVDHVVALSNAWQTGAQELSHLDRTRFANDPMNLLAVDGAANQQKGDGDAATWLPAHKAYRCAYVARQVSVKYTYSLWVTHAEKEAIQRVLEKCPRQPSLVDR